jgi:hypothetical protein
LRAECEEAVAAVSGVTNVLHAQMLSRMREHFMCVIILLLTTTSDAQSNERTLSVLCNACMQLY